MPTQTDDTIALITPEAVNHPNTPTLLLMRVRAIQGAVVAFAVTATPVPVPLPPTGTAMVLWEPKDSCARCPYGSCKKGSCIRSMAQDEADAEEAYEESFTGSILRFFRSIGEPFSRAWRWLAYAE